MAEIAGQPEACRRAAAGIVEQAATLRRLRDLSRDTTLVFTGMGSSYHACYPAIVELARAGIPAIHVDSAELLHFRAQMLSPATSLVAVSQSGESAEIVRLARRIREGAGATPLVSVTNGTGNTLAGLSDVAFDTDAGDEAGPSTMTFAAALVALAAVAGTLTGSDPLHVTDRVTTEAEAAATAIDRLVLDASLPGRMKAWHAGRGSTVILGRGSDRAAAEMAALTIKEAVGIPVESLETAQFRHGPLELAGPDLAVLMIATEAETVDLDLRFSSELAEAGARVLAVTAGRRTPVGVSSVDIGSLSGPIVPAAAVVPAQLLAWRLAAAHGREPGAYYRASKVTTVE